eukprot:8624646-Karenia_brevis.AAC.1
MKSGHATAVATLYLSTQLGLQSQRFRALVNMSRAGSTMLSRSRGSGAVGGAARTFSSLQ